MAKDEWVSVERNLYERHRAGRFLGYYVRVKRGGRLRTKSLETTKIKAARRKRDAFMADLEVALAAPVSTLRFVSLADFIPEVERSWKARNLAPASFQRIGQLRQAAEWFGDLPLVDYTPHLIAQWAEELAEQFAARTVYLKLATLSAAFTVAVARNAARENPVASVPKPRVEESDRPYVSTEQLDELIAKTRPRLRDYVQLIGWTGLRRNEALTLEWGHVSPDLSMIWVRGKGGKLRRVPIIAPAAEALQRCREKRVGREPLVFPDLSRTSVNEWFRADADAAGFTGWTPHYLRHGLGSRLGARNTDIVVIAQILGHKSLRTTERYMKWRTAGSDVMAMEGLQERRSHRDEPPLSEEA